MLLHETEVGGDHEKRGAEVGAQLPARNVDPPEAGRERQERGFLEAAHLDSGLEASRTEKTNILLYWASQLVVICYGGNRKRTHSHQSHVECPRALAELIPGPEHHCPCYHPEASRRPGLQKGFQFPQATGMPNRSTQLGMSL